MKGIIYFLILVTSIFSITASAGWDVDFSRRSKELRKKDYKTPHQAKEEKSVFEHIFDSTEPIQEVVLLNTERGFVPTNLNLRQGSTYKIHVVNVNKKSKNVSFIMNAFSEHHATFYGKMKSFIIKPKKDGVFTFQCPETSAQGRLVVVPKQMYKRPQPPGDIEMRSPASEMGD